MKKQKGIKKKKNNRIYTKEDHFKKNMEFINLWNEKIDRNLFHSYSSLSDEIIPIFGIVSYLNRKEKFGYIFDENGNTHHFLLKAVIEKGNLDWNKPVLFVKSEGVVKVLAISVLEISRQRGSSSTKYRTFGGKAKSRVVLRS